MSKRKGDDRVCALRLRLLDQPLGGVVAAIGEHLCHPLELAADERLGRRADLGARISALARPGEVVVSRTVTDLVAGSGLSFEDRGDHELQGLDGSFRLMALAAA